MDKMLLNKTASSMVWLAFKTIGIISGPDMVGKRKQSVDSCIISQNRDYLKRQYCGFFAMKALGKPDSYFCFEANQDIVVANF